MNSIKINQIIPRLIIFSIYLIPLIGLIDFLISIGALPGIPSRGRVDHPFPIMIVGKELLILIMLMLLVVIAFNKLKIQAISVIILMVVGFLILYSSSLIVMVSGLRESLCFVYIIAGKLFSDQSRVNLKYGKVKLVKAIKIVLLIELFFVLLQTQLMPPVESFTFLGSRPVGSFTNPNTIGVFGCLSILLLILFKEKKEKISVLYFICAILLAFLSGSRVAITLIMLILVINQLTVMKPSLLKLMTAFLGLLMLVIIITNINYISNKPLGLSIIEGDRVSNIINYLTTTDLFHLLFGYGWGAHTSWYYILSSINSPSIGLDSLYASMLAQIGLIGSVFFGIFMCWLFNLGGKKGRYLLVVFAIIGIQINVFEYYPANLLIFLALGIFISENKDLNNTRKIQTVTYLSVRK